MLNFNMRIDRDLHRRFKVVCVLDDKDMTEVVRKMIEQYTEKAEKRLKLKK